MYVWVHVCVCVHVIFERKKERKKERDKESRLSIRERERVGERKGAKKFYPGKSVAKAPFPFQMSPKTFQRIAFHLSLSFIYFIIFFLLMSGLIPLTGPLRIDCFSITFFFPTSSGPLPLPLRKEEAHNTKKRKETLMHLRSANKIDSTGAAPRVRAGT